MPQLLLISVVTIHALALARFGCDPEILAVWMVAIAILAMELLPVTIGLGL